MSLKLLQRIFTVLLVAGFILAPLSAMPTSASPVVNSKDPPPPAQPEPVLPGGEATVADPLTKLDSELQALAAERGGEPVVAYIHTEVGADLSEYANVLEVRALPYGGQLVVAEVAPENVLALASEETVLAAEVFKPIDAPVPISPFEDAERLTPEKARELREMGPEALAEAYGKELPAFSGSSPQSLTATSDWNGVDVIGAPEAWAKGYAGDGVNVAILDSGVDFGHPDLEDNVAFYDSGPYDGWPIALDPRSMRNYYYNSYDNWTNYNWNGDYSWYAHAWDTIACTSGVTETFEFNGDDWNIAPEIVGLSKSGTIRWSVHPDIQLPEYVEYNWVPFILLDTQEAGVYDTVITDLNFDYWLDGFDDTAVLGTTDPVLNQDLGSYVYTDTVVMTGTLYVPSGFWWLPPLWYGADVATDVITLTAGAWIYAENHWTAEGATTGEDGIADVSGGMVYYISDGELPVPGMDYLYPESWIEPSGELVAFMLGSDWVAGGDHGTLCASATAAAGQITGYFGIFGEFVQYETEDWSNFFVGDDISNWMPWLKSADEGTVQGPAPEADIIAIGNNYQSVNGMQGFYDAYTFLAYGVDGLPNSGDEFVDIVSMSYGDGTVHNDGWDLESRYISYINSEFLPNTTFFASSGNGGPGYGTINSPQGNTTVSVGASTLYGASTTFGSGITVEQINDGEMVHFSGRGPDAYGRPDPEVAATGGWGAGDTALNMAAIYNSFLGGGWFPGDGNNAWYEWGGTSRSAPEAAGVAALIYQAYEDAYGMKPTYETVRQILMGSADDLNHDVLMQGAGRVNADRATDVAGGLEGVYTEPSLLAAGEYMGTSYDSFANVLFPGDSWSQTFTVNNTGASAATVTVGDEVLTEMEVLTYTVVVTPYLGLEDNGYPANYFYYGDYMVVADPSLTTISNTNPITPSLGITYTIHGDDLAVSIPAGADFMEVQLVVPFEVFDFGYDHADPYSVSYNRDERWALAIYDWTDRNGDGDLWLDMNQDGIVNPMDWGDDFDSSINGMNYITQTEVSRLNYAYNYANVQEATVRLGDRPDLDNVVIAINHRMPNDSRGGWGADEYQDNPLMVKVVFYEKADWDLVTESTASLSVPAAGSATFDATFAIPVDQKPGLYEGAITVDDGTHLSIIPTTVNVAVPGDDLLFTLGGEDDSKTPYDNGKMERGYTWYSVYEEGDWRFFFYDAAAGFDQQYLYVLDQYGDGDVCGDNFPTANETLVWGPNPGDQFSLIDPTYYGPYSLQYAGGTWEANWNQHGWGTPREGQWWHNIDGYPLPENRIWATLWDGLNQVQFRNILLSGLFNCGEGYEATVGVFGVDAPEGNDNGYYIATDELSGSFPLDVVSPVDGLWVDAWGFGLEQNFLNQDVPEGLHPYDTWPDDLFSGWVYEFEVSNHHVIKIETAGPNKNDIDLYLMHDANGDGIYNLHDNREALASSTGSGPMEEIDFWGPSDGTYAVIMYGNNVRDAQFDLSLILHAGDGLAVEGVEDNFLDVTAGEVEELTVNWEVPGPGLWHGSAHFRMQREDAPIGWTQGPWLHFPVTINANGVDFARSSKVVDQDSVLMSHGTSDDTTLTYTITLVNDGVEEADVQLVDFIPEGTTIYEQCAPDPDDPAGDCWDYTMKVVWENGETWYDDFDDDCWGHYRGGDYLCWDGTVGPSTSGSVMIEYQVKVLPHFNGEIMNKADVWWDQWNFQEFFSLVAYTDVDIPVFLPLVTK